MNLVLVALKHQSNEKQIGSPLLKEITMRCLFVHNLGAEDTAASGARYSTLAHPVMPRLVCMNIGPAESGQKEEAVLKYFFIMQTFLWKNNFV